MQHAAQHLRREGGEAGEADGGIFGQRVADAQRPVVRDADHVAGHRVVGDVAVLAEEEDGAVDGQRLAGAHLVELHAAAELSRAEPQEGDPVAVVRVHVRLHLEDEAGDDVVARLDRAGGASAAGAAAARSRR